MILLNTVAMSQSQRLAAYSSATRFEHALSGLRTSYLAWSLLVIVMCCLSQQALAQQYTNRARFGIPFDFDPAQLQRIGAVEIRLYLSTSNGANWRHVQTVAPDAGRFQFDAPAEGRYLFAVRTVDVRGRLHPAIELAPELEVIVDQRPPAITLDVAPGRGQEVIAAWQIQDEHLDVESVHLEYRVNGGEWQEIDGVVSAIGQIRWNVARGGLVSVRCVAADRAGNPRQVTREVMLADGEITPSAPPLVPARPMQPDFERPVAESIPPGGYSRESGVGSPIIRPGTSRPPQTSSVSSSIREEQPGEELEGSPSVRRVNSLTFRVGYEIADIGPSGVSRVEFFITENGGRRWYHYGTDEDGQSPFEITVPADGEYGLSMRVSSGVGLSNPPPQPGEAPAMIIVVDRAPPVATLLPLRQGQGESHNEVLIEWTVRDDMLADRPVALFYAISRDGPWEPLTGWTTNTGRYQWAVSPQFRKSVYIRLDARDAAGNIASVISQEPVVLDRSRPQARITEIETIQP